MILFIFYIWLDVSLIFYTISEWNNQVKFIYGFRVLSFNIWSIYIYYLWLSAKLKFITFITDEEVLGDDREAARVLCGHDRLEYITIGSLMSELSHTFVGRSKICSTQCQNSHVSVNRFRIHIQLPSCTMEVFHGDYKF